MAFFRPTPRAKQDFRLFSGFAYYTPGIGGMFALLACLLAGMLLGSLLMVAMTAASPDFATRYGFLIVYPVQFLPPMLYASVKSRQAAFFEGGYALTSRHFGRSGAFGAALAGIVATLVTGLLCDPLDLIMPPMPEVIRHTLERVTDGPLWASVLSACIMAPFFEEWLCRGEVLRGLFQHMKPAWAIVISAAFFALIHGNPWQALPAFALGCLFGYVYYKTGSLRITMLMHATNNALAIIMSRSSRFADIDAWHQVMEPRFYWVAMAAAFLALVCTVLIFRRIPVEGRSNCDAVSAVPESL